jgi:hypothetical protein
MLGLSPAEIEQYGPAGNGAPPGQPPAPANPLLPARPLSAWLSAIALLGC